MGIAVVAALLAYEHSLVHANDLGRLNAAFFAVNGYISVLFLLFWGADGGGGEAVAPRAPLGHAPELTEGCEGAGAGTDHRRCAARPIAGRVLSGERPSLDDGIALYRSPDLLAVGWLANHGREQRHGNVCYFNVNRHINPTNVCVAHCKLCAFGRSPDAPGAYTFALEEIWQRAARRAPGAPWNFTWSAGCIPTCLSSISWT